MKLHLGSGNRHLLNFVNVDIQSNPAVDLIADIAYLPFSDNSIDLIYTCANLEHFGRNSNMDFFRHTSWKDVLSHWHSILKPGGKLYISTADFEAIANEYLKNKNLEQLIGIAIGGQKNCEDLHGMLFDFSLLSAGLQEIGFQSPKRYNWQEISWLSGFDDYGRSYLPHMDFEHGRLMMLNVVTSK